MTLRQAEDYLLGLEVFGMRFGLDRMHGLMAALGMPQRRFASIHVVGSNGKSSTVRFIAAILERHGLGTGSYTSPHLRSFRERVEVGESAVSPERFASAVERAANAAGMVERSLAAGDVTQFEALTAAAYHELGAREVEVGVIEAGLGGRYDATNVIPSRVQAITNVGLEHTRWLGPTIRDIAEEKLAVVGDHGTLVVSPDLHPDAMAVADRVVGERNGSLRIAQPMPDGPALRAAGGFQRGNFALACAVAEAFLGHPLNAEAVEGAAAQTRIPGRLDVVGQHPLTIHDGAHNPAGASALARALPEIVGGRRPAVLVASVLEDKDVSGMLAALLPLFDAVVYTRCANPRALSPSTLEALHEKLGGSSVETVPDPGAAVARAQALAGPDGAVVATGSIYLISDLTREDVGGRASTL